MPNEYAAMLAMVDGQVDELEKIALFSPTRASKVLGSIGKWAPGAIRDQLGGISAKAGRLVGAGVGAVGGAAAGAATAQDPKDRVSRSVKGAIYGGLGGLAGGQVATAQGRRQLARFGQRQLHSLTGYVPGRGILGRGIPEGAPKLTRAQRVKELRDIGIIAPEKKTIQEHMSEMGGPFKEFRAKRRVASEEAQRKLIEDEATSIPGLFHGYARGAARGEGALSRRELLKANLGASGLAMGIGLPVAFAAPDVAESVRTGDPRYGLRALGQGAGYAMAGGLPLAGATVLGEGVSRLSNYALAPKARMGQIVPAAQVR